MTAEVSRVAGRDPASGGEAFRLSRTAAALRSSQLRAILARAGRPGVISFAVGLPATDLFPAAGLAAACARLLPARPDSLQYAPPLAVLKDQVVALMAARGVRCRREQVFLTSGAQQGMQLLSRLLLDPGGEAVVEETIYEGFLTTLAGLAPRLLTVPTDLDAGMDVEAVAGLLARGARPAFIYAIPSGHNPLGMSLAEERRRRLVELARRHRVPVVEDDAYGFLTYDGEAAPALRALEERWVLYLGSFSKILAPALRAGWVVAPEELIPQLSALKHGTDLDTPSLGHHLVSAYLEAGGLPAHLERLRREYRRRRDAVLEALAAHLPPGTRWTRPTGGMYVWVELPPAMDATDLLAAAIDAEAVAFTPGEVFSAGGGRSGRNCLRLAFGSCACEEIGEGVRRLGRAVAAAAPR